MRARIRPHTRISLLSLAAVVGCLACHPDKGPGSIVVDYVLGNHKMCSELGVKRIEVTLYQGTLDEPSVEYKDMLICDNDGQAMISDIEPGVYSISAVGFDENEVATYDNEGQAAAERRVEIFEAAEATASAELSARPASLSVAWRLGDMGFGNCGSVGIDRFDITAYEMGGGTVLLEDTIKCVEAGDAEGFREVPDPMRLLIGSRFGEVGIDALDTSGNSVGTAYTTQFTPPGPGYGIDLRIECTMDGCYDQP